jgi:L-aminopeptidase/D-esterase-like protein
MSKYPPNSITDVPGIRLGHAQDYEALTGCTVILCEDGAIGGVDQRGGAPGTRETDLLRPLHLVEQLHAVLLAGGSAFGLEAASGVVRYLEEQGAGFDTGVAHVPIVPAAILFDLGIGRADVRPDAAMGYMACQNASSEPVIEGNVGAGTGCTVGKILGMEQAMKSGIGSASIELGGGVVIGALAAVNAIGDIFDPSSGMIIAGVRSPNARTDGVDVEATFANTLEVMKAHIGHEGVGYGGGDNTVIGVVATNAALNKEKANFVAQMAQDGLARTIRPAHTMLDGDTIFALSTGDLVVDVNSIGAFAAEALSQAILRAVWMAEPAGGLPAATSYSRPL